MTDSSVVDRVNPFDKDIDDSAFFIEYDPVCKVCGDVEDFSVGHNLYLNDQNICDHCMEHHVSGEYWFVSVGQDSSDYQRMVFDRDGEDKYKAVMLSGYLYAADFSSIYHEVCVIGFNKKYLLTAGVSLGAHWEETVKRIKSALAFRKNHPATPIPMTFMVDFFDRANDKHGLPWYWQGSIRQVV